jgi:hypothetical protein
MTRVALNVCQVDRLCESCLERGISSCPLAKVVTYLDDPTNEVFTACEATAQGFPVKGQIGGWGTVVGRVLALRTGWTTHITECSWCARPHTQPEKNKEEKKRTENWQRLMDGLMETRHHFHSSCFHSAHAQGLPITGLNLHAGCFPWNYFSQGRCLWFSFWYARVHGRLAMHNKLRDASVMQQESCGVNHRWSHVDKALFTDALWLDLEICCVSLGG